jgi:DNA-directed RNA polymerase subunit RPC12/RpoP
MAPSSRNHVFNRATFEEETLTCSKCKWKGKGADAIKIDLYNLTTTNEIRCPDCDNLLGILPIEGDNTGDSGDQLGSQIG